MPLNDESNSTSPNGPRPSSKHNFSSALQQFSTTNQPPVYKKHESKSKVISLRLLSVAEDEFVDDFARESASFARVPDSEAEKDQSDKFINLSNLIKASFKAHRDTLTTLLFMTYPDKKLLTGSLDS